MAQKEAVNNEESVTINQDTSGSVDEYVSPISTISKAANDSNYDTDAIIQAARDDNEHNKVNKKAA